MSKIYANPFNWGIPVSGTHYIQRPAAQEHITTAMEKQLHLIITGYRGTGKTSLLLHVLAKNNLASAYIDLSLIVSRTDLIMQLLDTLESSFPDVKTDQRYQSLRKDNRDNALAPVFDLWYDVVKRSNQKFTLAWDEFQFLVKLKDDIITELRENLRDRRGITHIFISHREDIMNEIFADHTNPFFYHREHLFIKELDHKALASFLTQRFRRMGLSDFDLANSVLEFTQEQPQLTQKFAHSLAQLWFQGTSTRLIERTLEKLANDYHAHYGMMWDNFGLNERRLLLGLASGYARPTELGFIKKFKLSATSTVHNTVLKLLKEGWLINREEGYYIYDPLFLLWLKKGKGLT